MRALYEKFISLNDEAKRKAHIKACHYSLDMWEKFVKKGKRLSYRDSVVLMKHQINRTLPSKALKAVIQNCPDKEITDLYCEPIVALQDMDWKPPEHIEFAYYSIYNLYRKYCEGEEIDDWLIINQCLSSETNHENRDLLLKSILS